MVRKNWLSPGVVWRFEIMQGPQWLPLKDVVQILLIDYSAKGEVWWRICMDHMIDLGGWTLQLILAGLLPLCMECVRIIKPVVVCSGVFDLDLCAFLFSKMGRCMKNKPPPPCISSGGIKFSS